MELKKSQSNPLLAPHPSPPSSRNWAVGVLVLLTGTVFPAGAALPERILLKPYKTRAATSFSGAISFHEIPGKPGAFLVVQRDGKVIYYETSTGASSVWVGIPVAGISESGIYSIAFHPDFVTNGRYFAYYNPVSDNTAHRGPYGTPGGYREVLAEYVANSARDKDSGKAPRFIAEFCCKDAGGHNGMYAVFGKDRMLYLSYGDGNSDGRETQSRKAYPGTVLRIDVDHPDPGRNYGIPRDNPFANEADTGIKKEIWSYGLRNPFKLAADPLTGDIWVGNVGGWVEDHVSRLTRGGNFGWPITEGTACYPPGARYGQYLPPPANCDRTGITAPTIPVPHADPPRYKNSNTNCVIGPVVYRANPKSAFYGAVFFSDFTSQELFAARLNEKGGLAEKVEYEKPLIKIIHMLEASDGNILAMSTSGSQFHYLDNPELRLGHVTGIETRSPASSLVRKGNRVYYNVAGRRLVRMPFQDSRAFSQSAFRKSR